MKAVLVLNEAKREGLQLRLWLTTLVPLDYPVPHCVEVDLPDTPKSAGRRAYECWSFGNATVPDWPTLDSKQRMIWEKAAEAARGGER